MLSFFFATLGSLFSVVNPLGALPIYLTLTSNYDQAHRRRTARMVAIYFFLILVTFFFAGTFILNFFGVSLDALRIAGGLIIVNSGYGLLNSKFEERRIDEKMEEEAQHQEDISFTPMAMPMLSGPGSISLLIGLYATQGTLDRQMVIVAVILTMGLVIFATLYFAPLLYRLLGRSGLSALSRIMGFLVMAIGIQMLIYGMVALIGSVYASLPH